MTAVYILLGIGALAVAADAIRAWAIRTARKAGEREERL